MKVTELQIIFWFMYYYIKLFAYLFINVA